MTEPREVLFADLERAASARDPQLADLIIRFLNQPDPAPGQPEDADPDAPAEPLPADAWTLDKLRRAVSDQNLSGQTDEERYNTRLAAWNALAHAPNPPPRLQLGRLLLSLYAANDEPARATLLELLERLDDAPVGWGLWQGLKGIYKQAEQRHDAELLGALIWRFDTLQLPNNSDISRGTWLYLRRRGWRYLRQLGVALPELYPAFTVQVLRHYRPHTRLSNCWVINQVWGHKSLIGRTDQGVHYNPPSGPEQSAFRDAWKLDAAPLLQLIEDARHDRVCEYAIALLQEDFKDALRHVEPAWLIRLGQRRLASRDRLIVKLLSDTPEFHPSRLRALGLHDTVLALLYSDQADARRYAIAYARTYATDLGLAALLEMVFKGDSEVRRYAAGELAKQPPRSFGAAALGRLLVVSETQQFAGQMLKEHYTPADFDAALFGELFSGSRAQQQFLKAFYDQHKTQPPALYYLSVLDNPQADRRAQQRALEALSRYRGAAGIGDWVKQALLKPALREGVSHLLRSGVFRVADLDLDWLKGLVMRPTLRPLALELLGDRDHIKPAQLGLPWLLALARQSDETLHTFAHKALLEGFPPADFGGSERLWSLATGTDEPEPLRAFAATYLKVHHPTLGPTLPETRAAGVTPQLSHTAYPRERVLPLIDDLRPDVRRLAVAIIRVELLNWQEPAVLYRLADSRHREPRQFAADTLLAIAQPDADPALTPPLHWLTAAVLRLAESPQKTLRETALTLIRRHYALLGGAARLAWLLESHDRDVRLFAVRLLWEKHHPRQLPTDRKPAKGDWPTAGERFADDAALLRFLRTALFALPPGRMERRDPGSELPERALPASLSKQRLIDVVRDLALEDAEFAALAVTVLGEFRHARAKTEWQACVAALARIRAIHQTLAIDLPAGTL